MAPRLRPYQLAAQEAILEARERGIRAQLVSLATGLGKTVLIATLPQLLKLRSNDVTLVIAHRDELIQQTVEKMRDANPDALIGVEKASSRASEECSIVVATVQTLANKRLKEFITRFGRRIALFVIDEAHHAAAPTYRAIVDAINEARPDAMLLGFTATPNRGDGVRLVDIFHDIVYTVDSRVAIDAGYLVPVRSFAVATKTDLDGVTSRGGDFVLGALAAVVNTKDRNQLIVDAYRQHTPNLKALIFTASVEHAKDVHRIFIEAGIAAAFASGETPKDERERIVEDFRRDRCDVLVNCGLYLEGFDVPSIQVVINARPTKSTTLYTQITGRGLRPVDEIARSLSVLETSDQRRNLIGTSAKPFAIILDMVDQAHRHSIVTLPSLWGLPPQIDAQGRPVSQVADKYEELYRRDPRTAARVRNAEQIEAALIELDSFADARARNEQPATWKMITAEHWRLERPPIRTARDKKGKLIPDFAKKFAQFVIEAKRIAPTADADAFALRILDADPRTITEESTQVDIARKNDEFVAMMATGTAPAREIAKARTLPEALAAVETKLASGEAFAVPAAPQKGPRGRKRKRGRTPNNKVHAAANTAAAAAATGVPTRGRRRRRRAAPKPAAQS